MPINFKELVEAFLPSAGRCALELFARDGSLATKRWAGNFLSLTGLDINPAYIEKFESNFPGCKAICLDTISSIHDFSLEERLNHQKYDFISADSPQGFYGDNYCEHFDYLNQIYKYAKDDFILYFNINLSPYCDTGENKAFDSYGMRPSQYQDWLEARKKFYGKERLSFSEAIDFYRGYLSRDGYVVKAIFPEFRASAVPNYPDHILYLACALSRKA